MLIEIWIFCSRIGKKVSELKKQYPEISDNINLTHKGGHVGFSFDTKPITDNTKKIWGFSPKSDLPDDKLWDKLLTDYLCRRK